ncbi:MAG: hypothetical protein JRE64_22550 [Deltaproteobacteria bacterium]|nr:hypothetical protein [Deltaproteobacteria bacterium]
MVYSPTDAERKITERSAVQEKLWKIFELEKIEKQLSPHKLNYNCVYFQIVMSRQMAYVEDSGLFVKVFKKLYGSKTYNSENK